MNLLQSDMLRTVGENDRHIIKVMFLTRENLFAIPLGLDHRNNRNTQGGRATTRDQV